MQSNEVCRRRKQLEYIMNWCLCAQNQLYKEKVPCDLRKSDEALAARAPQQRLVHALLWKRQHNSELTD
jgi:hypothetical protein